MDLLRKRVPRRRGGVCKRPLSDHMILYGQMDDGGYSYQNMSEADGQWCNQYEGQKGRTEYSSSKYMQVCTGYESQWVAMKKR